MSNHYNADIKLSDLLVNRENYRFHSVADEHEAMLIMLDSQQGKLTKLAESIAQQGLNPTKRIPVIKIDGGKYVVLEGNRRVTALKLMKNPDELSGEYRYKSVFQRLHATYKTSLPTTVECVVYPENERDTAEIWVGLEHTGENQGIGTVAWTTRQKERFDNRRHKKPSRAYQVLEFLDRKNVDTSDVKQTNLDRLLSTPAVIEQLGIEFSRGQMTLTDSEQQVVEKLKKVVERMGAGDFVVSQIYKSDQREQWIHDVLAPPPMLAPQPSQKVTPLPASSNSTANTPAPSPAPTVTPSVSTNTSQATTLSGVTNTSASTPQPAPTPPPSPINPSNYQTLVNPANPPPVTSSTKIVEIYKELQTVYLTGQRAAPHAVGALLRILIEITAQEYLLKTQGFQYDKNNSSNFRNPDEQGKLYNDLIQKLNYIVNNCGLPGNITQALRVLTADQLITPTLNQLMHSSIFSADAAAIKGLWRNLEKVFDHLVNKIQ